MLYGINGLIIICGSRILVRGGGTRGNGSEGANAGGPGGEGPPDGREVSFFKTIQSIRKLIHFSKIEHLFLPENPFFQRKIPKSDIFTRISEFFWKKFKGYHAPPAGGPGGEGPPDGIEVSFFKTIQSIRKWIYFSKISTFFLPENSFFSKEKFPKSGIFHKNFWVFLNKNLKFKFFWRNSINLVKFPMNYII